MYGFDYDWWAQWSERQEGPPSALSPDILGTGFAFRNLELLLKGVPARRPLRPRGPRLRTTRRSSAWVPSTCCCRFS